MRNFHHHSPDVMGPPILFVVADSVNSRLRKKAKELLPFWLSAEFRGFNFTNPECREMPPPLKFTTEIKQQVKATIDRYANQLFAQHSNLQAILPGAALISAEWTDSPAVVCFVTRKGLVPFGETLLPRELDGVKVDVISGVYEPVLRSPLPTVLKDYMPPVTWYAEGAWVKCKDGIIMRNQRVAKPLNLLRNRISLMNLSEISHAGVRHGNLLFPLVDPESEPSPDSKKKRRPPPSPSPPSSLASHLLESTLPSLKKPRIQ